MTSKQNLIKKKSTFPWKPPTILTSTPTSTSTTSSGRVASSNQAESKGNGVQHQTLPPGWTYQGPPLWYWEWIIRNGCIPLLDMGLELDYDLFFEDLRSHFDYSHETNVLVWDPRNFVNILDCEYAVRNRNGWLAALIAMQNKESVPGIGLTSFFFIVTKSEFGTR